MEEAEVKPEAKRQESKSKTNKVPETYAELVEDWKRDRRPRNSKEVADHV